jgi:hypothetical protein
VHKRTGASLTTSTKAQAKGFNLLTLNYTKMETLKKCAKAKLIYTKAYGYEVVCLRGKTGYGFKLDKAAAETFYAKFETTGLTPVSYVYIDSKGLVCYANDYDEAYNRYYTDWKRYVMPSENVGIFLKYYQLRLHKLVLKNVVK